MLALLHQVKLVEEFGMHSHALHHLPIRSVTGLHGLGGQAWAVLSIAQPLHIPSSYGEDR
jgi:hypothetical protein